MAPSPEECPVAVLGAGAWGTALAIHIARNCFPTTLWAHSAAHVAAMQADGVNSRYIPGVSLPEELVLTSEISDALEGARLILLVVPSHAFRETLHAIKPLLKHHHQLAWATKGLELGSHKLLHQIVREELGDDFSTAVVSGPTFAAEVAQGLPGALTVASHDQHYANQVAEILRNEHFRVYTADDIVGVELGGALKNVLAIAAGIADGLGFGANTRAALITRGLHELMRLGMVLGGKPETFMGLAGLGDLILTCTDDQSRNRRFGLAVGKGENMEQAIKDIGQVVEGVKSAKEAHALAEKHNIEMPIAEQVYKVLYENEDPHDAVRDLLDREVKPENI